MFIWVHLWLCFIVTDLAAPSPNIEHKIMQTRREFIQWLAASRCAPPTALSQADAREKLSLRLYDTPHEFNAEMQAEAWAWLKRWV